MIIEAEVPESVATAFLQLPADEKAHLRRVVFATVVEFAEGVAPTESSSEADAWDSFLLQSPNLAVAGLPADFSANLDHYLHGAPRRDTTPRQGWC